MYVVAEYHYCLPLILFCATAPHSPRASPFIYLRIALAAAIALIMIAIYAVQTIALSLIFIAMAPLRLFGGRRLHTRINHYMAELVWGIMTRQIEVWGGWNFVISGDEVPRLETVFAVSNHRFWLDWLIIMCLAARKGRLGAVKMFAKQVISLVPGIGWGMWLSDMVFLTRDWNSDLRRVNATFKRLRESQMPFWLVSHLEGTRLSQQKLLESQQFAKKTNKPVLEHCLLPRTKGFVATIQGLRTRLDAVYDITIVYDHMKMGAPSAVGLVLSHWLVKPIDVHIHIRRFPINEVPEDEAELAQWITDVWVEKDRLLDEFYRTGSFPLVRNDPFVHKWGEIWWTQNTDLRRM